MHNWFRLYGLPVLSSIPLPFEPLDEPPPGEPAWTFEDVPLDAIPPEQEGPILSERRCLAPCHQGRVAARVRRGPCGTWVWHDRVGTIHVTPDGRRVLVHAEPSHDERFLQAVLIGQISILLLQQHGYPTLHASAIQHERASILFLAAQGHGKSTIAASFFQFGCGLVADDAVPLSCHREVMCGGPGIPIMKLWQPTADYTLHLTEMLPSVVANHDKKLLNLDGRFRMAEVPVPIARIYLLERYEPGSADCDEVDIRRLSPREAHSAMVAQTSWGHLLLAPETARLMSAYARLARQSPVGVLHYPSGFEFQDQVCKRVFADLAGT